MLKLETLTDLDRLISDEIQESLTLDYKASASLGRNNDQRKELIKDVSAFANSAGGQIVYGIEELNRKPIRIDEGINPSAFSRETIEQIIDSNVQPRIEGLTIRAIPLVSGNCIYVINIAPATSRAPHQALDKKYYKRQNFQSVPMEDYEIRDTLRRAEYAEPFATILFSGGRSQIDVVLMNGSDVSLPIELNIMLGNKSSQPAYYSVFTIYIDTRLIIASSHDLEYGGQGTTNTGQTFNIYLKKMGIPKIFPLFREMNFALCVPPFSFRVPNLMLDSNCSFFLGYDFRTPGHHLTQFGSLNLPFRVLEIQMQPPTINR
jgi:Putative DNA-binding domain